MTKNKYLSFSIIKVYIKFFSVLVVLTGMNTRDNYNELLRNENRNYYRQSDRYRECITDAANAAYDSSMRARTWAASRVREIELAVAKIDFILNTELRILIGDITVNPNVQRSLNQYNPGRHIANIPHNVTQNNIRNCINRDLERIEKDVKSSLRNATNQRRLARLALNGRPGARGNMGKSFNEIIIEIGNSKDLLNARVEMVPIPLLNNQDRDDIDLVTKNFKYINRTAFQIAAYSEICIEEIQMVEEYYREARDVVNEIRRLIRTLPRNLRNP